MEIISQINARISQQVVPGKCGTCLRFCKYLEFTSNIPVKSIALNLQDFWADLNKPLIKDVPMSFRLNPGELAGHSKSLNFDWKISILIAQTY